MTYLRYSNLCADFLRNVLKEPFKAKAMQRQVISYRYSPYVEGKPTASSEFVVHVFFCGPFHVTLS